MSLQSLFYAALNGPVRSLLRSPLHGVASGSLAILNYHGRKSGRAYSTPLSYVRDGSTVRFLSSQNTAWWRNFKAGPAPVEIEIAGERLAGTARLWEGDSEHLRSGVHQFLSALPRDAPVYGIKLDADRKPRKESIESKADHVVLIEVELTP